MPSGAFSNREASSAFESLDIHANSAAALIDLLCAGRFPEGTRNSVGRDLGFPKMGMGRVVGLQIKSRFEPHYREPVRCLLRADVTKTGNLSVENFSEKGREDVNDPALLV